MRGYPLLSLLLPTHRTAPANLQDPIRVRNLIKEATDRLLAEFYKRDIEPLLTRLEALAAQIDYYHTLDGLALYVSQDLALKFYLPFPVRERVIIDETFATRDLVYALHHSPRYWVLTLSGRLVRLYEGLRETLVEVTDYGFPKTSPWHEGSRELSDDTDVDMSAHRDLRYRQFFDQVDSTFGQLVATDPLPLIVAGTDRNLAFFDRVSNHKRLIIATLCGNHSVTPVHKLAEQVWPSVQNHLRSQRQDALDALGVAVGAQMHAAGIGPAWRAGQEGRGTVLLVEEDYHYPARLDASGLQLSSAGDPTAPDVIDDAVDELIEIVLAKGGQVVFVDNGALEAHQRIAMILRFRKHSGT
jgi:hypothetical protein